MTDSPNIIRLTDTAGDTLSLQEGIEQTIEVKQASVAGKVLATLKGIPGIKAIMDILVIDGRHPADIQRELAGHREKYLERLSGIVANDNKTPPETLEKKVA